jgi:CheY-like chemotaxis protein
MEITLSVPAFPSQPIMLLPQFSETPKRLPKKRVDQSFPYKKKLGNRVLMLGRLRELALYRAEFLGHAGYITIVPGDEDEAFRILHNVQFDAIVLSYTLPDELVQRFAEAAREFCPDCPVIAITHTNTIDRRIAPDAIAIANEGPAALLSALRRVLQPA